MKIVGLFVYVAFLISFSIVKSKNLTYTKSLKGSLKKESSTNIASNQLDRSVCESNKPFAKYCLINTICCANSSDICVRKVTSCSVWNIFRTKCEVGNFEDVCG